jgi:hypothetical protein
LESHCTTAVKNAVRRTETLIDEMTSQGRNPEHDIAIDITGGQKTSSVVGAALTINRHIVSQYVQTNDPHQVVAYDLIAGGD